MFPKLTPSAPPAPGQLHLGEISLGAVVVEGSCFVHPADGVPQSTYTQYPSYPSDLFAVSLTKGPPTNLVTLPDGKERRLYAIYTPEDVAGVFYGYWLNITSRLPRGAEGKRFPATAEGERTARKWLSDHRHPECALRALRCPDA